MKFLSTFLLATTFFFSSCASKDHAKTGVVEKKVAENQVQIDLGQGEVNTGDKVGVFFNDCSQKMWATSHCSWTKLDEGTVTKVLDDKHSLVQLQEGRKVAKGMMIEKL